MSNEKKKFVHFGCWNNGKYSQNEKNKNFKNPISRVLNNFQDRNQDLVYLNTFIFLDLTVF